MGTLGNRRMIDRGLEEYPEIVVRVSNGDVYAFSRADKELMPNHYFSPIDDVVFKKIGFLKITVEGKMANLTENEKAIMKGGCDSDYDNFCDEPTWVFDAIDKSKLPPKVARGVLSSLVKKGLVHISDYEGNGNSDDMAISATEAGIAICVSLGYHKEADDGTGI